MELKTTASKFGLATSFKKDDVTYLVSTILKPGCFETIILKYPEREVVYQMRRDTQPQLSSLEDMLESVAEHIATVKMTQSTSTSTWSKSCASKFKPLFEDTDLHAIEWNGSAWRNPIIIEKIFNADIGYVENKRNFHLIVVAVVAAAGVIIYGATHYKWTPIMRGWNLLEWATFTLSFLLALSWNISLRRHYKTTNQADVIANSMVMTITLSTILVFVLQTSPYHLFWLFLVAIVMGFLSTRVAVVGRIAWFYGYLLALSNVNHT